MRSAWLGVLVLLGAGLAAAVACNRDRGYQSSSAADRATYSSQTSGWAQTSEPGVSQSSGMSAAGGTGATGADMESSWTSDEPGPAPYSRLAGTGGYGGTGGSGFMWDEYE